MLTVTNKTNANVNVTSPKGVKLYPFETNIVYLSLSTITSWFKVYLR